VRLVLENVDFRIRLGQAARGAVETWDWEHSIESVREVYQAAIQAFEPQRSRGTTGQRLAGLTTHALVRGFGSLSGDRSAMGHTARRAMNGSCNFIQS
jgi:hypothetical protein